MAGIAGIIVKTPSDRMSGVVEKMLTEMAHRCVDGRRVDLLDGVCFGHGALHITPESRLEMQPVLRDGVMLIGDMRLDNRGELIRVLGIRNPRIGDAELAVEAYMAWGETWTQHLLGDFAIALWDSRKDSLLLVRDHMGVKPIYYYHDNEVFAFASEIKALTCIPGAVVSAEYRDVDAVRGKNTLDATATSYRGIRRVEPATTLTYRRPACTCSTSRYWDLSSIRIKPIGDGEAIARFRHLFRQAVEDRLRCIGPVASHLSGGLDSSYVSAIARSICDGTDSGPLHTLSVVFGDLPSDESAFIRHMTKGASARHHEVDGRTLTCLGELPRIYSILDDGVVGGNFHLMVRLNDLAKSLGCRVVLDGVDGDTVVNHGLARFATLSAQSDWSCFAREVSLSRSRLSGEAYMQTGLRWLANSEKIWRTYAPPALAKSFRRDGFRTGLQQLRHVSSLSGLSCASFAMRAAGVATSALARRVRRRFLKPIKVKRPVRYFESFVRHEQLNLLMSGSITRSLEMGDHISAHIGVEQRHPFLDVRLIEFCLSLPEEFSLRDGWTRWILRRAMEDVVPQEISWRTGKADMTEGLRYVISNNDRDCLQGALPRSSFEHTPQRPKQVAISVDDVRGMSSAELGRLTSDLAARHLAARVEHLTAGSVRSGESIEFAVERVICN
jgi:asparagine synthase (glutamine-hydrolysing)